MTVVQFIEKASYILTFYVYQTFAFIVAPEGKLRLYNSIATWDLFCMAPFNLPMKTNLNRPFVLLTTSFKCCLPSESISISKLSRPNSYSMFISENLAPTSPVGIGLNSNLNGLDSFLSDKHPTILPFWIEACTMQSSPETLRSL